LFSAESKARLKNCLKLREKIDTGGWKFERGREKAQGMGETIIVDASRN
jgi:hypothetical protein